MMIEVQNHGFKFEKWAKETFFSGYSGKYTQKWDIPAEHNKDGGIPSGLRGLPVSVKTAKYGSPIGLGDAIRQRDLSVSFVMIVGFWTQRTASEKRFEDIGVVKFTTKNWSQLWGDLNIDSIQDINTKIKNVNLHYSEARELAQDWKKNIAAVSGSKIVINPKIDSKSQRRIQCSLPFAVFWDHVGRPAHRVDFPDLFGQKFPNPITSSPRKFKQS